MNSRLRPIPCPLVRTFVIVFLIAILALLGLGTSLPATAATAGTLLSADFNTDSNGFTYQDDSFGTSQPAYASGGRDTAAGFAGTGGLKVTLGGVDANVISGMSGGWAFNLVLSSDESNVTLSFDYILSQSSDYESQDYSQVLVSLDGIRIGNGNKDIVDQVAGDVNGGIARSTRWQRFEIFLGDLSSGSHALVIGGYNKQKDQSSEATTIVIDNVLVSSDNSPPIQSDAQELVDRLDLDRFKSNIKTLNDFGDRCRMSASACSGSPANSYINAQNWVRDELESLGYSVQYHNFTTSYGARSNLYVTKQGSLHPEQMYIVSAHLDGRENGGAADDNASGASLVLETARIFAAADVETDISIRFILWDQEESGIAGSAAYVQDRQSLQGSLDEPTWLGMIAHDMILYDHGTAPDPLQISWADIDIEFKPGTDYASESEDFAYQLKTWGNAFAQDYPTEVGDYSRYTDDSSFWDACPSISVRENRRQYEIGNIDSQPRIHPYYHTSNDLYENYDDLDFQLGFNTLQMTAGTIAELVNARLVGNSPPTANPQSVSTDEDTAKAIVLAGSDPDSDPLTYQVVSNPSYGSLSGSPSSLTYTPEANYHGADSFTFKVNDGATDSPPATVSITVNPVNDPPVANPQSVNTNCNTSTAITLAGSDVEGDPLSFVVIANPSHGSLSGAPPVVTYTPYSGYSGADSFSFAANDGTLDSSPAAVSITVGGCNTLFLPYAESFKSEAGSALSQRNRR